MPQRLHDFSLLESLFSIIRTLVMLDYSPLTWIWPHLNSLHLPRPYFQRSSHLHILGLNSSTCLFLGRWGRNTIQPRAWTMEANGNARVNVQGRAQYKTVCMFVWVCVCMSVHSCCKELQPSNQFLDLYWFLVPAFSGYLESFYAVPWLHSQWVMDRFRALTPTFNEYQH